MTQNPSRGMRTYYSNTYIHAHCMNIAHKHTCIHTHMYTHAHSSLRANFPYKRKTKEFEKFGTLFKIFNKILFILLKSFPLVQFIIEIVFVNWIWNAWGSFRRNSPTNASLPTRTRLIDAYLLDYSSVLWLKGQKKLVFKNQMWRLEHLKQFAIGKVQDQHH